MAPVGGARGVLPYMRSAVASAVELGGRGDRGSWVPCVKNNDKSAFIFIEKILTGRAGRFIHVLKL